MILNPTSKGKTSEAVTLAPRVKLGKRVVIPCGEARYDLADRDEDGRWSAPNPKRRAAQRIRCVQDLCHGARRPPDVGG
jgi:hypothetical protein